MRCADAGAGVASESDAAGRMKMSRNGAVLGVGSLEPLVIKMHKNFAQIIENM
jgi:hypothetical protein